MYQAVAYGQATRPSQQLQAYLVQASLVVEAVVDDETYAVYDTQTGNIETVHTLQIQQVFKGTLSSTSVEVHTPGGQLDGMIQTVSHGSSLQAGESGIYLLTPDGDGDYDLLRGNAGKITKLRYDEDYEAMHWGELTKYESWRQLREQIGQSLDIDLRITSMTSDQLSALTEDKTFCVKLDNPVPNVEDKTVEFDVMAKSSVQGLKFARAKILIDYPSGNLGEFIVDQEKIEADKAQITNSAAYTIEVNDQTKDQIDLTVDSPCDNSQPHYVLDTVYEKLATLTVEVNEWADLGTMNVEDFAIAGEAEYVNPASFQGTDGCSDFDDLCGEGEFVFKKCGFNVGGGIFNAGIQQNISLTGTEFGDPTVAMISIPHAESGGESWITFDADDGKVVNTWEDDFISLKVLNNMAGGPLNPFSASSGKWQVLPFGGSLRCEANVEVGYSLIADNVQINSTSFREERYFYPIGALQREYGYNITGGLEVYVIGQTLSDNNINASRFDEVMRELICAWEDVAGIEILYQGIGLAPPVSLDDIDAMQSDASTKLSVSFGAVSIAGRLAETIRTIDRNNRCGTSTYSYITDQDIVINSTTDFYINTDASIGSNQYDLYSVLMHEFGHVLGHSHANDLNLENGDDDSRLMYYEILPETIKRSIDTYGDAGAAEFWNYTKGETSPGSSCLDDGNNNLIGDLDIVPDLLECETSALKNSENSSQKCVEIYSKSSNLIVMRNNTSERVVKVVVSNIIGQTLSIFDTFDSNLDITIDSSQYSGIITISVYFKDGQICSKQILL